MIRVVLSVVLAVALLAASAPAIDDGRRDHTDSIVRDQLAKLDREVRNLVASDDPVPGPGARRIVAIRVPRRSWIDAGVENFTLSDDGPAPGAVVTWQTDGRHRRIERIGTVPVRPAGGHPIPLRAAGPTRLVLALDGTPGDPAVTVRRFIRDEGASVTHA